MGKWPARKIEEKYAQKFFKKMRAITKPLVFVAREKNMAFYEERGILYFYASIKEYLVF